MFTLPSMVAPPSTSSVMWLERLNGPVKNVEGEGVEEATKSMPPPFASNFATARTNAAVLDVTPSPTPPTSVMDTVVVVHKEGDDSRRNTSIRYTIFNLIQSKNN